MAINLKKDTHKSNDRRGCVLVIGRLDADAKKKMRPHFGREAWAMGYIDALPAESVNLRGGTALVFADPEASILLSQMVFAGMWRTHIGCSVWAYVNGEVHIVAPRDDY